MADKNYNVSINVKAEGAEKTVGELQQEFAQLKNEIKQTEFGSEQYFNKMKRLAEVRNNLKDMKEQMNALNPEEKFRNIGNVVSGVSGGFEAMTGAMALFGAESEDAQKAMIKLQAASNIASGLAQFRELGKVFEVLKVQLLSHPLFIITAVITGIGTALFALKDKIKVVGEAFSTIGNVLTWIKDKFVELAEAVGLYDSSIDKMRESAKAIEDAGNRTVNSLERQIKIRQAEGKATYDLEKEKLNAVRQSAQSQIMILEQLQKKKGELSDDEKKKLDELKKVVQTTNDDLLVLEIKHQQDIQKAREEAAKKYQEAIQKKNETILKSFSDELKAVDFNLNEQLKFVKSGTDAELQLRRDALNQKLAIIDAEIKALEKLKEKNQLVNKEAYDEAIRLRQSLNNDISVLDNQRAEMAKQAKEKEAADFINLNKKQLAESIDNIEFEAEKRKILAGENAEKLYQIEQELLSNKALLIQQEIEQYKSRGGELTDAELARIAELEANRNQIEQQFELNRINRDVQLQKQKANAKLAIEQQTFAAIGNLSNLFFTIASNNAKKDAERQKKIARLKFNVDKAMNIGQAIMNTAKGVTAALGSYPPPFNLILAGIVGAAGAAQVGLIAAQKFQEPSESGDVGGGAPSVPSVGAGTSAPDVQAVAPTGFEIGKDKEGGVKEGVIKAYVVESEITDKQKRAKTIESLSSF